MVLRASADRQPSVSEGSQEHRCAALSPPGDSCLTWLVDSGATCHIAALRFLGACRVLRKHQGTTALTEANVEVKIGREKISLTNVVITDIDFNVLSCFSMRERLS